MTLQRGVLILSELGDEDARPSAAAASIASACWALEKIHTIDSFMASACCIRSSACASVNRPLSSNLSTVAMNVFIDQKRRVI